MEFKVNLPGIEKKVALDQQYIEEIIVSSLYQLGTLSSKECCDILHIQRREFEELLPKFGLAIMPDSPNDIENELNQ